MCSKLQHEFSAKFWRKRNNECVLVCALHIRHTNYSYKTMTVCNIKRLPRQCLLNLDTYTYLKQLFLGLFWIDFHAEKCQFRETKLWEPPWLNRHKKERHLQALKHLHNNKWDYVKVKFWQNCELHRETTGCIVPHGLAEQSSITFVWITLQIWQPEQERQSGPTCLYFRNFKPQL